MQQILNHNLQCHLVLVDFGFNLFHSVLVLAYFLEDTLTLLHVGNPLIDGYHPSVQHQLLMGFLKCQLVIHHFPLPFV